MDVCDLTRTLIDIESVTPNEEAVGTFLYDYLHHLVDNNPGSRVERMEVEPHRFNIFAQFGDTPVVTLSTHMDTVPPFIASREDDQFVWGRGACDTKGIIASMLNACEDLLDQGESNFGLLFVVGEERNSAGALCAATQPRGSRFLINGEPTENRLALGCKGALRYEIVAHGKMAHSAYPELGESAINKLLNALERMRKIHLGEHPVLGKGTMNIGTITGGRAPNVIPDYAKAEVFIRLIGDSCEIREAIEESVQGLAETKQILEIPPVHLQGLDGFQTSVVAFTTDIPVFNGAWGQPFLIGPGSIHLAHTSDERVPKSDLIDAIQLYTKLVKQLKQS